MIKFKVGCNFDFKLFDFANALNYVYDNRKINEFYGALPELTNFSARPQYRIPKINRKYFEEFVNKCHASNIRFNYLLNAPYIGSKRNLKRYEHSISEFLKYLSDVGVNLLTITNPLLIELVYQLSDNFDVEISTIADITSISQIKYYKEIYNIKKVCSALYKNRSIKYLKNASAYCRENNIAFTLLVNEYCIKGYK